RMHYNHVHVGFAKGGILGKPFLHDSGGWHNPGELSINQTRKPEAVLTHGQGEAVESLVDRSASGGQAPQSVNCVTATDDGVEGLVDGLMWAQRAQARRGGYATVGRWRVLVSYGGVTVGETSQGLFLPEVELDVGDLRTGDAE